MEVLAQTMEGAADRAASPGLDAGSSRATSRETALASTARVVTSLATIGFGVHHLVARAFATRVLPGAGLPAAAAPWALAVGAFLVLAGAALLAGVRRPAIGVALASLWLAGLLALEAPQVAARWRLLFVWTPPGKNLVLAAGALLLAAGSWSATARLRTWTTARFVLAAFFVLCGVEHFVYASFAQKLVPTWIPGSAAFWVAACGIALIASGVGLLSARTARPAALFVGTMIAAWFVVLHVPRAVAAWSDPGEWSGVCESLAFAGIAWLVAGDPNSTTPRSKS
jgi:uncharacterized membrane protein